MNGGRNRGRTHCQWYTNRRGDRRLIVRMSKELALAVAVGDESAGEQLSAAIRGAAEHEEGTERE